MKVLVTGGTGFIGGALLPALVKRGHDVVALTRKEPPEMEKGDGVRWQMGDLSGATTNLPQVDAIIHLAQANVAMPDEATELYYINTMSTLRLLEHARIFKVKRFLLASTGNVYGWSDRPFTEEDPLRPQGLYPISKVNAENLVRGYQEHFETAILRIFSPYGPGAWRLISNLVRRVQEGQPITLRENGRPHLTPIFIDDMVEVLCRVLELTGHQTLNVAGDERVSLRRIAEIAGELCGKEPQFQAAEGRAAGDLMGDNALMKKLTGITSLVSLRDGLARSL